MNGNAFMIWLLTSPVHGLVSGNMTVLHVRGRKSGHLYHVPVNFVRMGTTLTIISKPSRTWWRNLDGGAPLSLHLCGKNVSAYGTVLRDPEAAADALVTCVRERPGTAQVLGVRRSLDGTPNSADLARAASAWVVIQLQLRAMPVPSTRGRA